jgi:hypothetical protein
VTDAKSEAESLEEQIAAIEARRAERSKSDDLAYKRQRLIDLAKIEELEIELGESNLAKIEVPYTPGCVTLVAARTPTKPEIKRYRFRTRDQKVKPDQIPDTSEAAEELAQSSFRYPCTDDGKPDKEAFEKVCGLRPGLLAQLGYEASKLVVGDSKK